MGNVTKRDANRVVKAIEKKFSSYIAAGYSRPQLFEDWDGKDFVIMWEEGPFEWSYQPINDETIDDELSSLAGYAVKVPAVKLPDNVLVEPINHYSVALYPA